MKLAYALLATSLLTAGVGSAAAQTRVLMGRVSDSLTTKPVTSGTVSVLGTAFQTRIKEDGSFIMSAPMREITLGIRSEGYRGREQQVGGSDETVSITMMKDYFEMEQIVVSGQATGVERRNLANAVAAVSAEELSRAPAQNMEQALKGKVTGAEMTGSGAPGGQILLRLRGVTSIIGNQKPLYIVDGVNVFSIDAINPNDIESIEILKGASASAMYGSKASNGVVVIKTKRGGLSTRNR